MFLRLGFLFGHPLVRAHRVAYKNGIENPSQKLISLFTGAGGLDIGLETVGFATLAANELEPYACESLRANKVLSSLAESEFDSWFLRQLDQRCYKDVTFAETEILHSRLRRGANNTKYLENATILDGDIRSITSTDLLAAAKAQRGEIDLVAGGPPCQPFSRSGKRETVECETGRLFQEFVRIVDDARPRWFLFENVKGLVITKTDLLETECGNCGKTSLAPFSARIGESTGDNIPCPRCCSFETKQVWSAKRGGSLDIILNAFESIGYKCHWNVLNAADFGAPQMRERLFIVGSRDGESFDWPAPTHAKSVLVRESSQPDLFSVEIAPTPPWESMFKALWQDGHFKYGGLDKNKAVLWIKNVVRPHAEAVTWNLDRPSPTIGAHQSAKLALAPFGVPEEQLARQQWHVLGKRQRDLPPVFVEHEYLSDPELLKLQTFPQSWYLFGTRMQRAFQIGNAVPPVLAEAVGKQIFKACRSLINGPSETVHAKRM